MVDTPVAFAKLTSGMTGQSRNRLKALFILGFPCVVFLAFLIYELNKPRPPAQPAPQTDGHNDSTNAIPPASLADTNPTR